MPVQAQRGSRIVAVLLLNLGGGWGWWSAPRPGVFNSEKEPRYSWYKRRPRYSRYKRRRRYSWYKRRRRYSWYKRRPRYSWYKRLDGPLSRSGRAWRTVKLLAAQDFEPRAVYSVGNRYSDYAISSTITNPSLCNITNSSLYKIRNNAAFSNL